MIIDWLSFIVGVQPTGHEMALYGIAIDAISANVPSVMKYLEQSTREAFPARRPYTVAWKMGEIVLYAGCTLDHALVEISGKGCEKLRGTKEMLEIVDDIQDECTRLDIAIDILGVTPDEILKSGHSAAFRTHSRIVSDTGTTIYVGSQKSERYARVYRYNPPHPRANLCRIELVHRKRYAKIAAQSIVKHGVEVTGLMALAAYGFDHDAVPKNTGQSLATVAIVKKNQRTLRWLIVQASPAFKRLVKEGTIENASAFLAEYFLEETPDRL